MATCTIATVPATGYDDQVLSITGAEFGASQGQWGRLYILGSNGGLYEATIDSWADTQIQFHYSLPTNEYGPVGYLVQTDAFLGAWSGPAGSTLWGTAPRSVATTLQVNDEVFGVGKGWEGESYVDLAHFAGQKPRGKITNVSITELGTTYDVQFYSEGGTQFVVCEVNGPQGTISPIREPLLSLLRASNPLPVGQN